MSKSGSGRRYNEKLNQQTTLFKGIYEFEDPSGALIAARFPQNGSIDLYSGSKVIVRPNQAAAVIYGGRVTDLLGPGLHEVQTENLPILSQLANWQFNFQNPLRCEIWFFNQSLFTSRKWGTQSPVMTEMPNVGAIPLRAFGHYNLRITDPQAFLLSIIGSRTSYDVSQIEEFVQATILEALPPAIAKYAPKSIGALNSHQEQIADHIEMNVTGKLKAYGLAVKNLRMLSLQPPPEMQEAIDSRLAMDVIGDQKEYLLYKAAKNLGQNGGSAQDPMQMMMGIILGKSLLEKDDSTATHRCHSCQTECNTSARFCPQCGKGLKK